MDTPPSPEIALARWFSLGSTSLTHPFLRQVRRACFEPLGIESDWLEAEPFSSLESGQTDWWLRAPRWNPDRFDRSHPAAADFGYLLEHPESFVVTAGSQGVLALVAAPAPAPAAADYLRSMEDGWRIIRPSVQAAQGAETLIYAAAGLILANDPLAGLFAEGDDEAFFAALRERIATAEFPAAKARADRSSAAKSAKPELPRSPRAAGESRQDPQGFPATPPP